MRARGSRPDSAGMQGADVVPVSRKTAQHHTCSAGRSVKAWPTVSTAARVAASSSAKLTSRISDGQKRVSPSPFRATNVSLMVTFLGFVAAEKLAYVVSTPKFEAAVPFAVSDSRLLAMGGA